MENKNYGCVSKGCCDKPNEGVKCDVKNCVYHSGEKHCTAKCIASSSSSSIRAKVASSERIKMFPLI